jgi:hypothetical protein
MGMAKFRSGKGWGSLAVCSSGVGKRDGTACPDVSEGSQEIERRLEMVELHVH